MSTYLQPSTGYLPSIITQTLYNIEVACKRLGYQLDWQFYAHAQPDTLQPAYSEFWLGLSGNGLSEQLRHISTWAAFEVPEVVAIRLKDGYERLVMQAMKEALRDAYPND